jgi:hypothetical protein
MFNAVSRLMKYAMLATVGLIGANQVGYAQVEAGKYTGGGFIQSAAGAPQKATFGFNLEGVDGDGDGFVDRVDKFVEVPNPFGPFPPTLTYIVWWQVGQGQFQYNDHGAGVKFHLDHDASYEVNPDGDLFSGTLLPDRIDVRSTTQVFFNPFRFVTTVQGFTWIGTYYSEEGTGTVTVSVNAEEDAFGSLVDRITVRVNSGPYGPGDRFGFSGYRNTGVLQGGNIAWHPAAE